MKKERNNPSKTLLSVVISIFALGFVFGRFLLTGTMGMFIILLLVIVLGFGWIQSQLFKSNEIERTDTTY
jgi:uncharacterized membrane protein